MSTVYRPTSNHVFNRQSVQSAIKWTQQRLKLYTTCPKNGLVVYCGLATTDADYGGKERRVAVHFEPHRPIKKFIYRCDSLFHIENLKELVASDDEDPFGFIVIDGNGVLFGSVRGTAREVLQKFSVDLPRKHGRGGQSALRFDRIRVEKRKYYVRRVAELATWHFVSNDCPVVRGIVLAGSGDLKDDLAKSKFFDPRMRSIIISTVDISHGGQAGFDQAITLSMDAIGSVALLHEKQLLERYMLEIERDTGRYSIAVEDTILALEMGAVESLIIWDDLELGRYELRHPATGEVSVSYLSSAQEKKKLPTKHVDLEVIKKESFLDWISDNYKKFGCRLEFVSDRSGLGRQFVMGFGGVGGILRWQVDFSHSAADGEHGSEDEESKEEDADGSGFDEEYDFEDGEFGL
mmetsp:Transcript_1964/g.5187  ORF Transcript_1964/g.5187 Transcript_1964/m.5187 type:complete len:407 (-) Transcript_1964:125-1345(-)